MFADQVNRLLITSRRAAGWAIVAVLPLIPEDSRNVVINKAGSMGWTWLVMAGCAAAVWWVLEGVTERFKTQDANHSKGWALSVFSGMPAHRHENSELIELHLEFCEIINSGSIPRYVVVTVKVPGVFGEGIIRSADGPIVIPAHGRFYGTVPIRLGGGISDYDLDILNSEITFLDQISGKSKTVEVGYAYSWSSGKNRRGWINSPFPLWQRIKIWQKR